MSYTAKVNIYTNERNLEIHELEVVDGELPKEMSRFAAHVTVGVETPSGTMGQPIVAEIKAEDVKEAYKKADDAIKAEIEVLKKAIMEDAAGPKIITPDQC